jgi:Asp-tRNA(Asn)/Glu-tRNA(Gln) amidotransferase A subunit family amidase
MMIMGKRFDDTSILKLADAFEPLQRNFPAAPGTA